MRWLEIIGAVQIPVFNDEEPVLSAVKNHQTTEFGEREEEILRQLKVRGVVDTVNDEPSINVDEVLRRV